MTDPTRLRAARPAGPDDARGATTRGPRQDAATRARDQDFGGGAARAGTASDGARRAEAPRRHRPQDETQPGKTPSAEPPGGEVLGGEAADRRPIRTFHPRRGRMSGRHHDAVGALWPAYGITVLDGDRTPLDLGLLFGRTAPRVLEIGFGMGDATAAMAAADPGRDYLAVEVHTPGIGNLLALAGENGLTNVRVAHGDAMELVHRLAPGSCTARRTGRTTPHRCAGCWTVTRNCGPPDRVDRYAARPSSSGAGGRPDGRSPTSCTPTPDVRFALFIGLAPLP
jgi:hypothetical protein